MADTELTDGLEIEPGPWDTEPDYGAWRDPETGYLCSIARNNLGALCGYVGVPVEHPWWGGSPADGQSECDSDCLSVHGGINWQNFSDPLGTGAGEWWFGFDCGHLGDKMPYFEAREKKLGLGPLLDTDFLGRRSRYRDWEYVRNEVTGLARQLKEHA